MVVQPQPHQTLVCSAAVNVMSPLAAKPHKLNDVFSAIAISNSDVIDILLRELRYNTEFTSYVPYHEMP